MSSHLPEHPVVARVAHIKPFCSFAFMARNDSAWKNDYYYCQGDRLYVDREPPEQAGSPCPVCLWQRGLRTLVLAVTEVRGQIKLWTCPVCCCILGLIWGHSFHLDCMIKSTGKLGTKGTDSWAVPTAASQRLGLEICILTRSPRWLMQQIENP